MNLGGDEAGGGANVAGETLLVFWVSLGSSPLIAMNLLFSTHHRGSSILPTVTEETLSLCRVSFVLSMTSVRSSG